MQSVERMTPSQDSFPSTSLQFSLLSQPCEIRVTNELNMHMYIYIKKNQLTHAIFYFLKYFY